MDPTLHDPYKEKLISFIAKLKGKSQEWYINAYLDYVMTWACLRHVYFFIFFFFFNDTATPEIYTLSLHDALPI